MRDQGLSIKEALLVVKRGDVLPQVLESAVLDLEQGDNAEVARLNGYLHAIVAYEPKPDSDWLQLTFPLYRPGCAEAGLHLAPDCAPVRRRSILCRVPDGLTQAIDRLSDSCWMA